MGYHVSIIRTGPRENTITQEEIISVVEGQFGFELDHDESGSITQMSREISGEEVLIFHDENELWAKNPGDNTLKVMIEIANVLGNGARVRGDEGESYKNETETYVHPDDTNSFVKESRIHWKDLVSWTVPAFAVLSGIFMIGALLFRYLSK
jgi:hypothetical protein